MKTKNIISGLSLTVISMSVFAISGPTEGKQKSHTSPKAAASADCAPASGLEYLNSNNVNAIIETGGSMWQDRPNSAAGYEVPKFSGHTAIYSGSLWMGGLDAAGNLKIAAVRFRANGSNDYWPGPLTTDGAAEITPDVCTEYDHFFHITKQEVSQFLAWFECSKSPDGCPEEFDGYKVPKIILEWPAHGDEALGQDYYLAPFKDAGVGNGRYDPLNDGDFPYYDFNNEIDCRAVRDIRLFGDDTYWWVFNDKGNIHTETNGASIGMEIRAQAFAFTTNDEVNDMTFYNYELINRSTFELKETYFAQYVDADLGGSDDDFVGCDVMRGLGFCYNGDDDDRDANGALGYGALPPAIGLDFFEGPYQDNDGVNNNWGIGPNEALNGIGYYDPNDLEPDSIVDNERYGMRRFIYYNRTGGGGNANRTDPVTAVDHRNYMRSIWKDGSKMVYGGNGYPGDAGATAIPADFMFPGTSDPLNWGTRGIDPGFIWTEETNQNQPFDRRFLQSAGPFTLKPGAVNDITVGVVFARAIAGNARNSVDAVVTADSKAQALFDNCFDVLDGPDAPDLSGIELNRELILLISNKKGLSNNYKKFPGDYEEVDPFIVSPDGEQYDNVYRFQGYQIYQLANKDVSVSDLDNLDKARLAFQCDIRDGVGDIINFELNAELGVTVPSPKVQNASNDGIFTSFNIKTDLFASASPKLVNFKTYYFIAISYAYNNYLPYSQIDPAGLKGQKLPYLPSRKSTSGEIRSIELTPHPTQPHSNGSVLLSSYGEQPEITRIEGQGNGGKNLAFTPLTMLQILNNSTSPGKNIPTYQSGRGPIDVKVIDPRNVQPGQFTLKMFEENADFYWELKREDDGVVVKSEAPISVSNEQIIPQWGISVNVSDKPNPGALLRQNLGNDPLYTNGYINATMKYADSSKVWLTGIADESGSNDENWIRTGSDKDVAPYDSYSFTVTVAGQPDPVVVFKDQFNKYQQALGGTWAPFTLSAHTQTDPGPPIVTCKNAPTPEWANGHAMRRSDLEDLRSVDIVFTSNKDNWTRCPVIELQEENALAIGGASNPSASPKGFLRESESVDKDGKPDGTGKGMGWFPGYAIDVETGERLNMAFGEDSWLGDQNGSDMIWNPTSVVEDGFIQGDPQRGKHLKWGGKHYIYVFGNSKHFKNPVPSAPMPSYDEGKVLAAGLVRATSAPTITRELSAANTFSNCLWVGIPMLIPHHNILESDVTVSLRVDRKYDKYAADTAANGSLPMYTWNMATLQTITNDLTTAKDALEMIKVVPNPYYAFAEHYEQLQLDTYVKITNLPEQCEVTIYTASGTRIRKFNKSDPSTEIKWDLKNQESIPIAGGMYLIHIKADGVGEKIVKWFGVLRPVDLQGF